jgi:magnesium transporter
MTNDIPTEPWEQLEQIVQRGDSARLADYMASLPLGEIARVVSRIDEELQEKLLGLLGPQQSADLILGLSEAQSADLLRRLTPAHAAAILDHVPSDEQADLLALLAEEQASAVVKYMSPKEAEDAMRLSRYPAETAGGLMITEYLAYPQDYRVVDVIADLRRQSYEYAEYELQYIYVVDAGNRLVGVLRFRDLLLSPEEALLTSLMLSPPHCLQSDMGLDELRAFFDRHPFFGAPVVEKEGRLVGVVLRVDVEEALGDQAERTLLHYSGLFGGEEFRTMPLNQRLFRRLSWLSISVALNLLAASIVGLYQDTLEAAIALAVFLPVISGVSGNSANQALAVSVRELSLGLIKPYELGWVILRESAIGIFSGLSLGFLLGLAAFVWKGNLYLALVVGGALATTTLLAVCVGGSIPLLFKRMRLDPAIASGPITLTLTDMCGFFVTLASATMVLPWLN